MRNNIKNISKIIAIGAVITGLNACGPTPYQEKVEPNNYLIYPISLTEVDSFNIKLAEDTTQTQQDSLDVLVSVKGYPKGTSANKFLLEDGAGNSKFCEMQTDAKIDAVIEALMDKSKVKTIPKTAEVFGYVSENPVQIKVMRMDYDGRTFDKNETLSEDFNDIVYDPILKKVTLKELKQLADTVKLTNIGVEGYILGTSKNGQLAFILGDAEENEIICFKSSSDVSESTVGSRKYAQLATIIDALNQEPKKIEVTGNYTGKFGGTLFIESVQTPYKIGQENNSIVFEKNISEESQEYVYISIPEAKTIKEYNQIKIIGNVEGVSSIDGLHTIIQDYTGETIFCMRGSNTEYTQLGAVMLENVKENENQLTVINGKSMYKYAEITGQLIEGSIKIHEIKDVWSEKPIQSKADMENVLHREGIDHRVNYK